MKKSAKSIIPHQISHNYHKIMIIWWQKFLVLIKAFVCDFDRFDRFHMETVLCSLKYLKFIFAKSLNIWLNSHKRHSNFYLSRFRLDWVLNYAVTWYTFAYDNAPNFSPSFANFGLEQVKWTRYGRQTRGKTGKLWLKFLHILCSCHAKHLNKLKIKRYFFTKNQPIPKVFSSSFYCRWNFVV